MQPKKQHRKKSQIIQELSQSLEISKKDVNAFLDAFVDLAL